MTSKKVERAPWAWTWVRQGDEPVFPMRGADPSVKGGYSIHAPVMHPDDVLILQATVMRLWAALDELIGDHYRGGESSAHADPYIMERARAVRDDTKGSVL